MIGVFVVAHRRWGWPPDKDQLRELAARPAFARMTRIASYALTAFLLTRPGWRSPGYRVVGLRRVDADTGRVPGLRRRLAEAVLDEMVRRAIARLNRPRRQRVEARRAEVVARRAEIRERFADDPKGRAEAESELSRESAGTCGAALVQPLALTLVIPLTALASPRRQTIVERLTGIVVVRD